MWGKAGDIYPCWNSDGSTKWPWLTRDIHDWESPNGVVVPYHQHGFGSFPDEQPHFLDDMAIKVKEDEEDEEYLDEEDRDEEMEVEADVNVETETEDEKQPRKVKGVKEGIVKTKMGRTRGKGEGKGKGKGKAKKGKM